MIEDDTLHSFLASHACIDSHTHTNTCEYIINSFSTHATHTFTCTHICTGRCTNKYMLTQMHICRCAYKHNHMHTSMYMYTHAKAHVHTHTYIWICTHTYMHAHAHRHMNTNGYVNLHASKHIHTCTHVHAYAGLYLHTNTGTHTTHIHSLWRNLLSPKLNKLTPMLILLFLSFLGIPFFLQSVHAYTPLYVHANHSLWPFSFKPLYNTIFINTAQKVVLHAVSQLLTP